MSANHQGRYAIKWRPGAHGEAVFEGGSLLALAGRIREPVQLITHPGSGAIGLGAGGETVPLQTGEDGDYPWLGTLPAMYPEWLGDRTFQETHGVRFAYVTGEMAQGIASPQMVIAAAEAGFLGFLGAAGMPLTRIEAAVREFKQALDPRSLPYGVNVIHSPHEPAMEERTIELLMNEGVRRVSASAFMKLSPAIVRYACTGLAADERGRVIRRHHLFVKLSRPEVARHFLSPAPRAMLEVLVAEGKLTETEATLAARVPLAEDVTVEADSGGHTDNRPLPSLFPVIAELRDRLAASFGYTRPIRLGAAGGIGSPAGAASAFALGASYIVTGSVNQAAVESGMSEAGKRMLAQAEMADVVMAPSADMFELGVKVQVLKRGTLFSSRASELYEVYRKYGSLEAIPQDVRSKLETNVFRAGLDDIWNETARFFGNRDPEQLRKADADPKYRMALVFRWYLGNASKWGIQGSEERRQDYQIWCGPAMGAFNAWVANTKLEPLGARTVAQIGLNLLEGAARLTRMHQLRTYGVPVPGEAFRYAPVIWKAHGTKS
ncbi:PfaD family polyunsaturated fatty acid/polyketide biosynthesis protein [Paenibacillus sp. MBLB4367]|uniref:PfaD family polyunsaturated fatty acid/polyketide biosynthesis protein n=1 Tax=Paenibacillus sp. MBLB4367 TaxID=3384767 RepID=UPI00390829AA